MIVSSRRRLLSTITVIMLFYPMIQSCGLVWLCGRPVVDVLDSYHWLRCKPWIHEISLASGRIPFRFLARATKEFQPFAQCLSVSPTRSHEWWRGIGLAIISSRYKWILHDTFSNTKLRCHVRFFYTSRDLKIVTFVMFTKDIVRGLTHHDINVVAKAYDKTKINTISAYCKVYWVNFYCFFGLN